MVDLSVIIVSYNTREILLGCLQSVFDTLDETIAANRYSADARALSRGYEVIVVDNASTDDSLPRIEAWCAGEFEHAPQQASLPGVICSPRAPAGLRWASLDAGAAMPSPLPQVLLLRSSRNTGFAGGNNLGLAVAAAAGCRAHWLLNTDTVVAPHSLLALLRRLDERPSAGAVGSHGALL